jgi:hypothetical protein
MSALLYDLLILAYIVASVACVVYFMLTGNAWFVAGAIVSGVLAMVLDDRVKWDR